MNYVINKSAQLRSENLVSIIQDLIINKGEILEIGCNAGRNLNYLYQAGYTDLTGIEINKNALNQFKLSFNECYQNINIINSSIEESITKISDQKYDIVFTMAVLQHIHPTSDWIFDHMVRISRGFLITMEVEEFPSPRHFPRNYKKIFESRGMRQIKRIHTARIFKRK